MSLQSILTEDLIRPVPPGVIRRFEVPDVDKHGAWIIERVTRAYPHIHERQVVGWLRGIVYMTEYLFLQQDNSVALAQALRPDGFTPGLVIWERFVWCREPANKDHVAEAAGFYERFKKWAEQQDAKTIVVGEQTDVPANLISERLGKLFERKHYFSRV